MEWPILLLIFFGSLCVLMISGLPVAFCFLVIDIIGILILWGGQTGLNQFIHEIFGSVTKFTFLPVPMFILMGEIMFHSGVAPLMMKTLDKWLGRLPGRLSLLAVVSGTILSTLTGVSMASVAMLGSVLVPQMEERGYKKSMSLGPILGSGGLAIMIPPSSLAVILGAIGEISIGKILMAIIVPGLVMVVLYAGYIIIRCILQPEIAPVYDVKVSSLKEKLLDSLFYIFPVAFIVFLVVGLILLGMATPTEAAATGAFGCIIMAACYKKLNWTVIKRAFMGTLHITIMIFTIVVGASMFSQILAFSGATAGVTDFAAKLPVAPIVIIIMMQFIVLFLGCFMDVVAIMLVTLPIFVPLITSLGYDPVWFAVLMLINMEIAGISPPFGLNLFVIKGVTPEDTTMGDIYRASIPFVLLSMMAMAIIMAFPKIALWLPGLMH
ncbi:TRAP transporter large permease subunit [Thermodesulfobacteriota bacterium]